MKFLLLATALSAPLTASAANPQHPASSTSDPSIVEHLATTLPPCESTQGDGHLNLDDACIGDLCAYHTPAQLHQRSTTSTCSRRETSARVACTFDKIKTQRSTRDAPGSSVGSIYPTSNYQGKTLDGLGLGVSMRCFLDTLPAPSSVKLALADDGTYTVQNLRFKAPNISISDRDGDGRVDSIQLSSRKNKIRATNSAQQVSVPR